MIFIDFRPAEYHHGKCSYVAYYVQNPKTNRLVRRRIKLNRIKGARDRARFAARLCAEINRKLYEGWNPFMEEEAFCCGTSLQRGIREFLEAKGKNVREETYRGYHSYLKFFKKHIVRGGKQYLPVKSFSQNDAERIMRELGSRTDIGAATYNSYLEFFRNLFNYFIARNWLKENPFSRIARRREEQKKRELIPPHIRRKIAEYFIEHDQIPYLYIMQLCYRCFIRPKEILMLKIKDIDFVEGVINIPAEVSKNHNARTIGVPEEIMVYLRRWEGCDPGYYIFSSNYLPGQELKSSRDTAKTWSRMRRALNLPGKYQFYSLKDTGITEMLEDGVPSKYVKELADHSSLAVTERYMHKTEAKIILKHNRLEFCGMAMP
jgi:integrase